MKTHIFQAHMWLPLAIEPVFAFFGDVANLSKISPPSVRIQTITPLPIEMRVGTIVEHRMSIRWFPIRWRSEITVWEPPVRFVDEQRSGPYRFWKHRHEFEVAEGGTWVRDHIEYRTHGWLFEPIVNRIFVAPELRRLFAHRQKAIRDFLAPGTDATNDRIEC
ncbi:MAG: SRPBCC family protein [Planctomycetes bacterium]|nr:SRPBCC family protein [Planctomycetota bacterium]